MVPLDTTLKNLIGRHATVLKCAAIIHSSGEVTNRVGDFTEFHKMGLASSVLGPYGDPLAQFQLVAQYENNRNVLPRSVVQGHLFALLDKPQTDFVVVVFGLKNGDLHEHLQRRREIATTTLALFGVEED